MRKRLIRHMFCLTIAAVALTASLSAWVSLTSESSAARLVWLLIVCAAITVLTMGVGITLMLRVIRPVDPDAAEGSGYDELRPLIERMEEQKRELKLRRSEVEDRERRLDSIMENMTEGLAVLDPQGVVILINEAARRMLGAPESFSVGQHMIAACENNLLQAAAQDALGGVPSRETFRRQGLTVQMLANPLLLDGAAHGAIIMLLDVTEPTPSEGMRREFTANVSHELKTPITSISGYAEMMMTGLAKPEDVPRLSGRIYSEAQRLITLIDDIIKLSRLDEGTEDETAEPVDLYAVAERCAGTLEAQALRAGVTVAVTGENAVVSGNARLIEEMIANLCDNAIKYNQPGGSVNVAVGYRDAAPFVSVSDDGIGIAPEHMGRIFERFYRVDKSRSKDTGGTGLGLSIVKHAAWWHAATIEAESQPGRGTRIAIVFDGKGGE